MHITEILLEYKLDTNGYGYWIDAERKPHPVEYQSHQEYLESMPEFANDPNPYLTVYNQGWLRIISSADEFSLKGNLPTIKRNWRYIARSMKSVGTSRLAVDIIASNAETLRDFTSHRFHLPNDNAKLLKIING